MTALPLQESYDQHIVCTYMHFHQHLLGTIPNRYNANGLIAAQVIQIFYIVIFDKDLKTKGQLNIV